VTAGIDWGDHPDWRARLEVARQPSTPQQSAWDAHFDRMLGITSRSEPNPNRATSAAYTRTEAQYGQRPTNEETQ
jgi:hypothetical protein